MLDFVCLFDALGPHLDRGCKLSWKRIGKYIQVGVPMETIELSSKDQHGQMSKNSAEAEMWINKNSINGKRFNL